MDPNPSHGPAAVYGLGLIVLDQQVYLDEYPAADSKVFARGHRTQVGGPVPTALAQLRRLGLPCRMLGAWGDDLPGKEIEADLARTGIGFDPTACRSPAPSGFAQVWVEAATGRRTLVSVPPAGEPSPARAAAFGRGERLLHLDGWGGDAAVAAAEQAKRDGALISIDAGSAKPATDRLLRLADVVNAPLRFLRSYCGTSDAREGATRLLSLGPRLVTVTDGEHGAGVYTREVAEWRPAFPVRAADTCGAGDVFCGGLIDAVLAGQPAVEALRFAMATAALKVTRLGNREALATRDEIEAFLAARGA